MRSDIDYYVYVIFRLNGTPCYVGKGRGRRAEHHARFSHNGHLRNIYKQAGGVLPLVKIREGLTDREACETERAFIAAIGREDLGLGPLVNFCDGGEGSSNAYQSEQKRRKISEVKKGRVRSDDEIEKWRASMKTFNLSAETRAKISESHTGKPKPWVSEALKGRPQPKVRERQLGSTNPDHAARMVGNKNSLGKNLGNQNAIRKLDEDLVADIKRRIATGERHRSIAESYGVHKSQISSIATGRTWKHVQAN